MASPEPSGYPHHLYSHQEHQQLPPLPPLPPPPHQGMPSHDVYSDRSYPYPDRQPPFPHRHPETEQPLDLSLSRSPRPHSAGAVAGAEGGVPKRSRLEEGGREAAVDMGRADHPSVCMMRGCNCHSPMPIHHTPHYSRHRHSPYPQYPVSGHSSPDLQPYSHTYSIPQPPPPASPGMMYGSGSSSPYIPPPPERPSRSPGMGVTYGGEMVPQRPSPGSLLCPPPHSSISPLSISTHVRDTSPCPPSQSLARMRDVSPRPFYRPFEDVGLPLADMPHAAPVISSSSQMSVMEPYPSEDDLTASSSLLMLSNTTSEARPTVLTRQIADSSVDNFRHREQPLMMEDNVQVRAEPTQSDSGRAGVFHQLPSHPALSSHVSQAISVESHQLCSREARSEAYHPESQPVGPAQDGTVASSYSSSDLTDSSPPTQDEKKSKNLQMRSESPSPKREEKSKNLQSRLVKVVGTTPLAALREERAKKHAANKKKMKDLLAHRNERHNTNSNDSEGASDLNSSGQASPRSCDGLDNDVGQGFPIPPDPNLKMSALDYLISKVLVERIDVPFKACNTEIKEIYTGAKKGRLTLVDLIELQVEASLKA